MQLKRTSRHILAVPLIIMGLAAVPGCMMLYATVTHTWRPGYQAASVAWIASPGVEAASVEEQLGTPDYVARNPAELEWVRSVFSYYPAPQVAGWNQAWLYRSSPLVYATFVFVGKDGRVICSVIVKT